MEELTSDASENIMTPVDTEDTPSVFKYADDCKVTQFVSNINADKAQSNLQYKLLCFYQWAIKFRMLFHSSKFEHIQFHINVLSCDDITRKLFEEFP